MKGKTQLPQLPLPVVFVDGVGVGLGVGLGLGDGVDGGDGVGAAVEPEVLFQPPAYEGQVLRSGI